MREGKIEFDFSGSDKAIKFDDTDYYKKKFNCMKGSKAVDFLIVRKDDFFIIEVKDYSIGPVNKDIFQIGKGENSIDRVITRKISMTLAALLGAHINSIAELKDYTSSITDKAKNIRIVFFFEGDIVALTGMDEIVYKLALVDSLKAELKWLTNDIVVLNLDEFERFTKFKARIA